MELDVPNISISLSISISIRIGISIGIITITSISYWNIIIIDGVTIVPRELPNRSPALLLF